MYIRTKDGVYEVAKDTKGTKFIVVGKNKTLLDYRTFITSESDIIKEADTIEELCDRAFAFHKDSPWESPDLEDFSLGSLKEQILESTENTIDEFIFKLAIWTEKGLIYVAKTNDEGVIKLKSW